jgi:hypothetical protein
MSLACNTSEWLVSLDYKHFTQPRLCLILSLQCSDKPVSVIHVYEMYPLLHKCIISPSSHSPVPTDHVCVRFFPFSVQINLANISASNESRDKSRGGGNSDSSEEDDEKEVILPPGLVTWQKAVAMATSAAQITLCVQQLNGAISWEKSIMKVVS